jgi:tellurite resistance protein TerC
MARATAIRSPLVFDNKHPLHGSYRMAKRIAIGIVGGSVLIAGVILAVMPILPGWPAIFVGLGILGLEFAWARVWLKKAKEKAQDVGRSIAGKPAIDRSRPPKQP